jgi:hypothetical protein
MPQMGFDPMIPVCERAKTVHALDRVTTVIGHIFTYICKYSYIKLIINVKSAMGGTR